MRLEILCLLHFCRPGFRTLHIPPWSSLDLQVLRICRSQRLDMGPKRVMWVRRYQGQCRALRPLGHQGCRLRNHNKDQPLCSRYTSPPGLVFSRREATGLTCSDAYSRLLTWSRLHSPGGPGVRSRLLLLVGPLYSGRGVVCCCVCGCGNQRAWRTMVSPILRTPFPF